MRRRYANWAVVAAAGLAALATACAGVAAEPNVAGIDLPPVVFEGFGLDGFAGSGSLAAALQGVGSADADRSLPLDIVVRGPTGRDAAAVPLATEIRSRLEQLGLTAGVATTRAANPDGFTAWTGGVAVASEHAAGRDILELRTSLTQARQAGVLGVEVGPRIERRLRRGAVLFLDGKAEARTQRSLETGSWLVPGSAAEGTVGVAARTGLTR